ncbi:MAG: transcription elongation factor GreA [Patescibacteria group bacterium]|nr:transcription elongation factor GreA [Patescibacteria group bacterium]
MDITYLSQERYDELSKEFAELKTKGRKEIAKRLKQAKELGDLSENSEYQDAREEQSNLEKKINELDNLLRKTSIIKKSSGTATVRIGSKVKLEKDKGEIVAYTIVGSSEARPTRGFISNESPVGKGVLGKKVGDVVNVETPKKETDYKILGIE